MSQNERFPDKEEIRELSKFIYDERSQIYGFTIVMKTGNIRNYILRGNFYELSAEIKELREQYDELAQEFRKGNNNSENIK